MEFVAAKYANKLIRAGLCNEPIVAGLDHELAWNQEHELNPLLAEVFELININGLVFGCPAEPFATIIDFLAKEYPQGFCPRDTETRTFLHNLPVIPKLTAKGVAGVLAHYKSVIVPEVGIVAHGNVSPEQAFVTFSSVCFSSFVLFFAEYLHHVRAGTVSQERRVAFERAVAHLEPVQTQLPSLASGPFSDHEQAMAAMAQAGRSTVDYKLVDSYFGNVSCLMDDTLLISQTGSSLDELEGLIDLCPLDGSSTACLTASSELTAHTQVYAQTQGRTMLHGHPRFTVILSMDCPELYAEDVCDVGREDMCHIKCPKARYLPGNVPIVPGEVGTGPYGLAKTLPLAMKQRGAAAVWGHGLFTMGNTDFNEPFKALLEIENDCRKEYFKLVQQAQDG